MNRMTLLAVLTGVATLALTAAATAETAEEFPSRPIRIIVPQAAGSGIDLQARVLAQKMNELWGQPGIVENRPGANAIIGTDAVAKAAPDGYTLVYAPVSSVTTNALIYKNLPYDPIKNFAPITQTVANPLGLIANPVSGPKSIKELVAQAKANPGKLNYGSFGIGNMTHLQGVLLSLAADIQMTHVPYRGQTPEVTDILAGQISLGFTTTAGVSDLVESGKLNLLATFGDKRSPLFPNTPTPTEAGYPSAVVVGWAGILAPAGTPKPIVDKLYAGMAKALSMPDVKDAILKQGSEPVASKSADDFANYVKAEIEKFRPVIKAAESKDRSERMAYVPKTHRFGLLTPSSNTTQEPEFVAALPPSVSLHTGRVAYRDITPEEQDRCVLELETESRKLGDAEVDAIVFAATAPTLAKGKGYDRELIKRMEDASGRPATTAATAFVDALHELGVNRISLGQPWSKTMEKPMVAFMQAHGFEVVHSEAIGIVSGVELGRIGPERAYELGRSSDRPQAEAVVMPGGNWIAMPMIERLEHDLGKPVLCNNAVSIWAGLRMLKRTDSIPGYGRLLRDHLA